MLITDIEYLLKLIKKADTLQREEVAFIHLVEKKAIEYADTRAKLRDRAQSIVDEVKPYVGETLLFMFLQACAVDDGIVFLNDIRTQVKDAGVTIDNLEEIEDAYLDVFNLFKKVVRDYTSATKKLDKIEISIGEIEASFEVMGYVLMDKEIVKLSSTREAIDGLKLGGEVIEAIASPIV